MMVLALIAAIILLGYLIVKRQNDEAEKEEIIRQVKLDIARRNRENSIRWTAENISEKSSEKA